MVFSFISLDIVSNLYFLSQLISNSCPRHKYSNHSLQNYHWPCSQKYEFPLVCGPFAFNGLWSLIAHWKTIVRPQNCFLLYDLYGFTQLAWSVLFFLPGQRCAFTSGCNSFKVRLTQDHKCKDSHKDGLCTVCPLTLFFLFKCKLFSFPLLHLPTTYAKLFLHSGKSAFSMVTLGKKVCLLVELFLTLVPNFRYFLIFPRLIYFNCVQAFLCN